MSDKNFMSFGDAETILTDYAQAINNKDSKYTTISYSDWLAMSDAQKESGKYYVTGVPNADGTVKVDLMTKLWENADPTSSMASGTTFALSSSDYDHLLIITKIKNDSTVCSAIMSPKDNGIALTIATEGKVASRNVLFSSATSGTFYSGYFNGAVDNDYAIPLAIYGIKTSQTVEIKAIARDVSTSADNCQITNDLSVGDALVASNDVPFRFGYDSTTGKYGYILNQGGADTVIPFKSTELVDINPEKRTDSYYITTEVGPSGKNQYIPVQGYSKIAVNPRYSNFDISFMLKDGTETTAIHPTQSQHTWTSYMDIPQDATLAHIIVKYQNSSTDILYYSLLA